MFKYKQNELSEHELLVMKCIWDAKDSITCQEIMAKLREEYGIDYQDTTVYTYLKKLKLKGFATFHRRGVIFWEAIRPEEEYRNEQLEKVKNLWFKGSSKNMVAEILSSIEEGEKEEIKEMVKEWQKVAE